MANRKVSTSGEVMVRTSFSTPNCQRFGFVYATPSTPTKDCKNEDQYTPDHMRVKPGDTYNAMWIYMKIVDKDEETKVKDMKDKRKEDEKTTIYGKWLVMTEMVKTDEIWSQIVQAMINAELPGCEISKCSTMMYHPSCSGPGPHTNHVICVYTCEHDMDAIGFKLVELVKQDIKYKTDAATLDYKYVHAGSGKTTIKTIYYNNGKPSFTLEGDKCVSTTRCKDIWHTNMVECPGLSKSEVDYGRWILTIEYKDLTFLWHILKKKIEFEREKFGALRKVCPPKRERSSSTELPVFHVYTNKEKRKSVGLKLVDIVECDITFELKDSSPQFVTLYWNDGEPDYEVVRRKGITKNWRTGEDMK